jgi:hypothetical protein
LFVKGINFCFSIINIYQESACKSILAGAERYSKGFSSWDQFVAMMFCQLAQAKSLREICGGLASCLGKLRHLGLKNAPGKSTLSYANAHRPWQMFQDLFYETLDIESNPLNT